MCGIFDYKGRILIANSREEAVHKCVASFGGIRLYLMVWNTTVYLYSYLFGDAKKLLSLGFEKDNRQYVKPTNIVKDFSENSLAKIKKIKKFKNPSALMELKEYVTASDEEDEDEIGYAVLEGQGMIVAYESMRGYYKIPKVPLYKEVSSVSNIKLVLNRINKAGLKVANLSELDKVCKALFGSSLNSDTNDTEDYTIEYTKSFLEEQFNLFNSKYFDNELPEIPLRWQSSKRLGACSPKYNSNHDGIEIREIVINNKISNYKEFRDTLVHEMCHALCNLQITPSEMKRASDLYGFNSTKFRRALGLTDDTAHSGKWLALVNKLNSKFPELKLKRLGSGNYDSFDESGSVKQEVIDEVAKGHLLARKLNGKSFFTFVNEEAYNKLIQLHNSSTWPYGGEWIEYYFYPNKLAEFIAKPFDSVTSGYKPKVLKMLKDMGVIKGKKTILYGYTGKGESPESRLLKMLKDMRP